MALFAVNALIAMAKLAFRDEGLSTQRLIQLAANANNNQLSVIPSKQWKSVRSLPQVCKELYLLTVYLL
jgi:hypothetical protein